MRSLHDFVAHEGGVFAPHAEDKPPLQYLPQPRSFELFNETPGRGAGECRPGLHVTAASEQDRAQVGVLAEQVQTATGQNVELAYGDLGYTGQPAAAAAQAHGLKLEVVKLPMAKRGFVLLPRRLVVERSFGWASRFRRLARDYERLSSSLACLHWLAFVSLALRNLF